MDTFDKCVIAMLIVMAWVIALVAINKTDVLENRISAFEARQSVSVDLQRFVELVAKGGF